MRIRLPQILLAMALILLAGLAAVQVFERRQGGAGVPGIVLLSQPQLDGAALTSLAEAIPGAHLELVDAGDGPLAPFDGAALQYHVSQGYDTVLLAPGGPEPPSEGWALRALVYPAVSTKDAFGHAIDDALLEIRKHSAERPYLVGMLADPVPPQRVKHFLNECVSVFEALDPYRRSAVVVLGARHTDGAQRYALRINRGRWGTRARPDLADLLEPRW
ncbi:MAG: hypothetical protein DHS20C15_17050 [Planctomycetota bacterium]|nr:MAG: hypothetical protein DHS20C15_17050 [Planctomycetota bacterium]